MQIETVHVVCLLCVLRVQSPPTIPVGGDCFHTFLNTNSRQESLQIVS